jgi:hypothetical protein
MKRVALGTLCLALSAALWWAALWLALPAGWLQGGAASFASIHLAPPFLAVAAVWAGKRAWGWRKAAVKERAEKKAAADGAAAREASDAAHLAGLARLRAHLECRGAWALAPRVPKRLKGGMPQCEWLEASPEGIKEGRADAAPASSLREIFSGALSQCASLAWLPTYCLPGQDAGENAVRQEMIRQARLHALGMAGIENPSPPPACAILPGSGALADRLAALFEDDPALPAVMLVGIAALPDGAQPSGPKSSPAVAALLFTRPGLAAPSDAQIAAARRHGPDGPMMPFWEREQALVAEASPMWGSMPLALQPEFLKNFPPIATLHRTGTIREPAPKRGALAQQIHEAVLAALIRAGLREPQPDAAGGEEGAPPKPKEPAPPNLGWLVHDAGPDGLAALAAALAGLGCELDPLGEASDVMAEHGDAGEVRGMLMLAESLIRAALLQKPVLMAGFDESKNIVIGLACPPQKTASTELPAPQLQKAA